MSNHPLYESYHYDVDLRITSKDTLNYRVFNNKSSYVVESGVSFDSAKEGISSIDYFLGSIASNLMFTIVDFCHKKEILVEEIEGKIKATLFNPLTILGVKGYEDKPFIDKIKLVVYLYADCDSSLLVDTCIKAIDLSPIYNSLKASIDIAIDIKPLL